MNVCVFGVFNEKYVHKETALINMNYVGRDICCNIAFDNIFVPYKKYVFYIKIFPSLHGNIRATR